MAIQEDVFIGLLDALNDNHSIDVSIQDNKTFFYQYFLMQENNANIVLTSPVKLDDEIINVSADHGFTTGSVCHLWEGEKHFQAFVKAVNTNAITLDVPVDNTYSAATKVVRGTTNLNLNGAITNIKVNWKPYFNTVPIDITKVIMTIVTSGIQDDGKFGGLDGLTNGFCFRKLNKMNFNLGNYKTNKDFRDRGAEVTYTDKAPSAEYTTQITFDLKSIFGNVLRLDPMHDEFCGLIRDDLSTATSITIVLCGHYTEGEQN